MKRINPSELPEILNKEVVDILVMMSEEIPQSKEWKEIFDLLPIDAHKQILDRKSELHFHKEKKKLESFSEEEKEIEEAKWKRIKEDPDPYKFYGNMGQPETVEEFKNRYGVYPPGYDKDGNKMEG